MSDRVVCRLLVCVALFAFTQTAAAQGGDAWWGRDKALHLSLSATISAGTYAAVVPLESEPLWRLTIAATVGLGAGVGKELFDATGHGDASWKDLTWDVIGVALGSAMMWLWDLWLRQARITPYRPVTVRTARTGMRAVRTTFSATLPNSHRSRPVCPCVPMTIMVAR